MKSTFALRAGAGLLLGFLATLAMSGPAEAHPLGNFTINHYSGIRVATASVLIDQVIDFAEIPTFTERRLMDTDLDGAVSSSEASLFERQRCTILGGELSLAAAGRQLGLRLTHTGLSFPMGQGSLTMRLVCVYEAQLDVAGATGMVIDFEDGSYAERSGWREVVVEGDGLTVIESDAPSSGTSNRLTNYPSDLLAVPPGQDSTHFTVRSGGPALAPLSFPDARPIGGPDAAPTVAASSSAADGGASAPAGVSELGAELTALFQAPELTLPIAALSIVAAFVLGVLHALSPGHGKTVMAAYLVGSRGTGKHAVGLGLTVTVSHTLGVLALGGLTLSASLLVPPETLYPILSIGSGVIVMVIGAYLLITRIRSRAGRHSDHGHGHLQPEGWHEHDGIGHSHLPQETLGRRGLFALGLSGGMVPSVSALLLLVGSISLGRPLFGILLTVCFGVGMATVLVGLGLALVHARRLVERLPARKGLRLAERLPALTAVVVLLAGVVITGQGLAGLP